MERSSLAPIHRLLRYYEAGIVNTIFGYGLYALFVAFGLNMYLAQIVAHVLGASFNFLTYSRHVFYDRHGSKFRFFLSYVGNYLIGLATMAASAQMISSPYVVGMISVIFVSIVNYVVLKHLVFLRQAG